MSTPRLEAISICAVKSTAMRPVEHAQIATHGLVGDREWMVVDADGAEVTARDLPTLMHVSAVDDGESLRLEGPGVGGVDIARPTGADRDVSLFGAPLRGRPAGPAADQWLRAATGRDDVSLVWCPEPRRTAFEQSVNGHAAFQDEGPVSLLSTGSVDQLNEWVATPEPLPAVRFRSNLLISGVPAFAEDAWKTVRIGTAGLRVVGPIARCVMTTIDPVTLDRGKEPIRTMAIHRRWNGKTWFAVHLVVESPGSIAVGDPVDYA